jgi:uncharacterized protein YkwD
MARASLILIALLIASALSLPAGQGLAQALTYTGCGGVASPPTYNPAYEQTLVELVNSERAANGNLPPLKRSDSLDQAARYHAIDMAQDGYFEHDTYDRNASHQLVYVCDTWQRLGSYYPNANAMGENIASGQDTPADVMEDWMNSSGHRANILSTNSREIGVGYSPGGIYGTSWVQDFGKRNNVYPLVIAREEDVVSNRNVSLYIYGQGVWSEMRLRNDSDAWGPWQPFQSQLNWSLADLHGVRTVWVEMRQGAQTYITSDTIFFNNPATYSYKVYLPAIIR